MDIQRLRQILNELNPIFWNPEIDRQLEATGYPNKFPIESAKYRYAIALGKSEKKRSNKLHEEVEKCLSSYDNAIGVLLGEFTSPFAQQVLFTHQKLIGEFAGITSDNYQSWTELLVCMSHKDFWAELNSSKTGKRKKTKKKRKPLPKTDFSFGNGQAFFKGKDLGLPTGETIEILQKLVRSMGKVVKHKVLDSMSTDSNASDILKGRILTINKALKRHNLRYRIESRRGVGYVLPQTKAVSL